MRSEEDNAPDMIVVLLGLIAIACTVAAVSLALSGSTSAEEAAVVPALLAVIAAALGGELTLHTIHGAKAGSK